MGQVEPKSPASQQPAVELVNRVPLPTPRQTPATDPAAILGLNRGDQRVVTALIVVAFVLMCLHWYRLTQYRPAPIVVLHPEGYVYQLDVNQASWVEWMQLEHVGETLARRIVEDRRQRGPFASVNDVQRVSGIGPKTLESLRPHLKCTAPAGGSAK